MMSIETSRFEEEHDYETRYYFKFFFPYSQKFKPRKASLYFFSTKKLTGLFLLEEDKPSSNRKIIKPLTVDNLFPPLRHSR